MRQVKVTARNNVVHRIAVVACVAVLGVGAAACGDDSVVTPQAPSVTNAPAAVTTPPASSPQSGGSGF